MRDLRYMPGIAMHEGLAQAGRFGGRVIAANPGKAALGLGGAGLVGGYALG
jgi:hypothetical protein